MWAHLNRWNILRVKEKMNTILLFFIRNNAVSVTFIQYYTFLFVTAGSLGEYPAFVNSFNCRSISSPLERARVECAAAGVCYHAKRTHPSAPLKKGIALSFRSLGSCPSRISQRGPCVCKSCYLRVSVGSPRGGREFYTIVSQNPAKCIV